MPYTYLIGWSELNKWYYGARWARNCTPTDLWKTYFTSSKYVHEFMHLNGEPDVIQIREIFSSVELTRIHEEKVIRRMKMIRDDRFLNKGNSRTPIKPPGSKPWNYGKIGSQANPFKGVKGRYNVATRQQISESVKIYFKNLDPITLKERYKSRDSCNNRRWMYNVYGQHKRVKISEIDEYQKLGWIEGRNIAKNLITGKFEKETTNRT